MDQKQIKNNSNYDPGKLDQKEKELIRLIRDRFRFGDITISTRDGLPYQIVRYVDIERF